MEALQRQFATLVETRDRLRKEKENLIAETQKSNTAYEMLQAKVKDILDKVVKERKKAAQRIFELQQELAAKTEEVQELKKKLEATDKEKQEIYEKVKEKFQTLLTERNALQARVVESLELLELKRQNEELSNRAAQLAKENAHLKELVTGTDNGSAAAVGTALGMSSGSFSDLSLFLRRSEDGTGTSGAVEISSGMDDTQTLAKEPAGTELDSSASANAPSDSDAESPLLSASGSLALEEEDDAGDGVTLIMEHSDKGLRVKGGTLAKLVERLTYDKTVDTEYVDTFLLTYRSFMSPEDLLSMLFARFDVAPPEGSDPEAFATKQKIIRLRVANALKTWLDKHFYDFDNNTQLLKGLTTFINQRIMQTPGMEGLGNALSKLLLGIERPAGPVMFSEPAPPPIIPRGTSFAEFDPLEIARQFCLLEHELYKAIRPKEVLNRIWNKKEPSPDIEKMTARFNLVSGWVATQIVQEDDLSARARIMKKFLTIAQRCREMNNFNAMMEILSGLHNAAIYRLKNTWAKVHKSKEGAYYKELSEIMSREENYKNYRTLLRTINPPCIPYLGLFLSDTLFIEEGNRDFLKAEVEGGASQEPLINFDKRRKVAVVIRNIQQYQQTPYNFTKVDVIYDYLENKIASLTDKQLYKHSLICEAKGGAPKK